MRISFSGDIIDGIEAADTVREGDAMNRKEQFFFEKLTEEGELCARGGLILDEVLQGKRPREEGYDIVRRLRREGREAALTLCGKGRRAFPEGGEAAISLVEKTDSLLGGMKDLARLLSVYETDAPEKMKETTMLIRASMEEIAKIYGYAGSLDESYMKAEARCGRIVHYEERGDRCFQEGLSLLFRERKDPFYVIQWKDLMEQGESLLDGALCCVHLFQRAAKYWM